MKSHPLIRHHTNCIIVISTSPLISHPLLYDITPTICVTSYTLYIRSYPLLMSSHYSSYYSTNLTYETTSSMQFKIYSIHVTSKSLVCVITPTLLTESHTHTLYNITFCIGITSFALQKILHRHFMKSNHHFLISHPLYLTSYWHYFVIISTILLISHQLYIWDLILYICRHSVHWLQHIHYISTITATKTVSHTYTFHDITPFVYMTLHRLYV